MIVKSFRANSAVRALKKVREEMGQEAIVLKTRQIRLKTGGTAVEITACIEKPTVGVASQVLAGSRAAGMATDEAVAVATERVKVPPTRNRVQEFVPERVVTDRKEAARLLGNDLLDEQDGSATAQEGPPAMQDAPTEKQQAPAGSVKSTHKEPTGAISTQPAKSEQRSGLVKQAAAKVAAALKSKPTAAAEKTSPAQQAASTPTAVVDKPTEVAEKKPQAPVGEKADGGAKVAADTAGAQEMDHRELVSETAVKAPIEKKPLDTNDVDHHTIASAISAKLMEMMTDRIAGLETRLEKIQHSSVTVATPTRPRSERSQAIDHVCDVLGSADVPVEFVRSFERELAEATESDEEADVPAVAHRLLTARLAEMMVPHFDFVAGDRLVFVGPAGAGKSSVMGKLAFRLAIKEKMKVNLATLDSQKMAAHEEIASYADVLGVPLEEAPWESNGSSGKRVSRSGWVDVDADADADKSDDAADQTAGHEPVRFIDTPALPTDDEAFAALCKRVEAVRPTNCFAVFSALTRSSDILAMSEQIATLAPSHVILTMTDLTSCCGSLIAATQGLSTKVAFVCNSPAGRGQVLTPDPAAVARMLLNTGVDLG